MEALGLTAADYEADAVELWPENWEAWRVFCDVSGQWRRAGMDGVPVALDYGPLFARMDRLGLSDDEWNALFADVRVLEVAALAVMAENRK